MKRRDDRWSSALSGTGALSALAAAGTGAVGCPAPSGRTRRCTAAGRTHRTAPMVPRTRWVAPGVRRASSAGVRGPQVQ
ncbi:hypothetical protein [Micromonospora sagamiensis]|uniref:hypothetical protein n=1 Tax=Micromonospora sagamiensis TaxID=47875 RepID=UPI0011A2FB6C|nr:hypothetical protein [Micromonospora sagamiensis]BCL16248.1 hypothetical protein GCM10017556_39870 [Micromonospora sagamiensis]